jgi:hypothetical protein
MGGGLPELLSDGCRCSSPGSLVVSSTSIFEQRSFRCHFTLGFFLGCLGPGVGFGVFACSSEGFPLRLLCS